MSRRARVNKRKTAIGEHWTIQKIVERDGKLFGFCISDDGVEAYIPRPVAEKYSMTPDDEGAGFTAPTREPASMSGKVSPQIMLPITWDTEVCEASPVAAPAGDGGDENELDTLLSQLDIATGVADRLVVALRELEGVKLWLDHNYPESTE